MDVFTLVGKITIDTQDALNNLQSVIGKAQELENLLNGTQTATQTATQKTGETVEKATKDATKQTGNALNKWSVMMGNLATQAVNKVYNAGKSFFQTGFEYNQNMEKWTTSFKTYMGGDLEKAKAFMEEVRQFAVDTPLSLQTTVQTAVKLLGSNIDAANIIDTLHMLGDIANGDTEKMSRLGLAYSQVMSAGYFGGNDPLQFKEAGVPMQKLLQDYYASKGIQYSYEELLDMQKNKDITSEDVHNALVMATSAGGMYFNAMNNIMDTEYGQAQKTMDSYEQAAGSFTKAIFDVFSSDTLSDLNDILSQLNEWATKNPDALKNLGEAFSDFATGGLDLLLTSLQTLLGWWNENRAAFDSMLVLLGGIAIYAGHPAAGTALIATGAVDAYADAKKQIEGGSPVGQELMNDPEIAQAVKDGTTDELGFVDWVSYNIGAPLVQFLHNLIPGLIVEPDDPSVYGLPSGSGDYSTREDVNLGENSGSMNMLRQNMHNLDMLFASTDGIPDRGSSDSGGTSFTDRVGALSSLYGGVGGVVGIAGLIASVQGLTAAVQSMTGEIPDAIASGVGNITVTGTVTTGNVTLDTGAVVGQIAPRMNLVLGGLNAISGRG